MVEPFKDQPPPADNYVLEIQPYVVSIDQPPSSIQAIVNKIGKTNNSAMLTCKMWNGDLCSVSQRQLHTILGDAALQKLVAEYSAQPK